MTNKPRLQRRLDEAAEKLLSRHFPAAPQPDDPLPDELNQIRAFDAVVKYYGPRTKLGVKEDDEDGAEYKRLRDKLHRRTAPRPRRDEQDGEESGAVNGSSVANTN
jgi:hypothetical protein